MAHSKSTMHVWDSVSSRYIKKEPIIIHIDRKQIFSEAAQKLHLAVKTEIPLQIKENDFIGKLEIINSKTNETKTFHGDFSRTEHEAIQSAYNEALKFYVENKFLVVDDFNLARADEMYSEFIGAQTYLWAKEDHEALLENELRFKTQGYKKINSILNDTCNQCSDSLPIAITKYKMPWNEKEMTKLTFTGDISSTDPLDKIAQSFVEMSEVVDLHGYELPIEEDKAIREYRNKTLA